MFFLSLQMIEMGVEEDEVPSYQELKKLVDSSVN